QDCVDGWELLPFNTCHNDTRITSVVNGAMARLDGRTATPTDIRPYSVIDTEVRRRAPHATWVSVGYPHFFTASGSDRTFLPGGRCEGIKKADQRWVVEKIDELNGIARRNALMNGFLFANPGARFNGHELCGGGEEWIYPVFNAGKIHPTAKG